MNLLTLSRESLLHFFFPFVCDGCGRELPSGSRAPVCARCLAELPATGFEVWRGNPVEKKFWGRLQVQMATAQFYFTQGSRMQMLMHAFKYRSAVETGYELGRMMGRQLPAGLTPPPDVMIPLPLYPDRERKRGYNQATVLCKGIGEITGWPFETNVIKRNRNTTSQTRRGRVERWNNMEGNFNLGRPETIAGKHILLVDDVVTTGATLEACGQELLKAGGVTLSIATLCCADR